ncbi:unnamed protein product [Zymoseptoria tritici ST99CH_3D7]|uniref:Aminoglycoside phosphotransferase domain-containing protein n=2 Tax=Zymoseptoria tritici TaxID=1047171 RepID=A0A1X7S6K1_ZYMT9|nr:unnamed protein product [Zymoseptoria tritici ST99CH_3D7]SMR60538.1 unnamed protein product [Zymoseptoria tritici ST99CH_1E4]
MPETNGHRKAASFWTGPLVALLYKVMSSKYTGGQSRDCGGVLFISPTLCIKACPGRTRFAEANAMEFVRQNTSIPVPKVHLVTEYKGRVYIVMQRIKGLSLGNGWYYRSAESKQNILLQLKAMAVWDCRLPSKDLWGPFPTIREFHKALSGDQDWSDLKDERYPDLTELSTFYNQSWHRPVFTHGDLSSFNILCRGDTIVGIIDWETAGWLPSYWEYVTAWNVNPQNQFWQVEVDKFLEPFPQARRMDSIRRKYFGDY